MKICEKYRKDHIFACFHMFPFHGNIFSASFKRKCKKTASFRKCVYLRKYEIFVYDTKTRVFFLVFRSTFCWRYFSEKMKFSFVLQGKQAIGQLFVEDVYIFPITSFRKRDCIIANLFFLLHDNEGSFINFLKICS